MPNYKHATDTAKKLLADNYVDEISLPIPILSLAKGLGMEVFESEFKDQEIAGYISLKENAILVNKRDSESRQAFTVAHELGHLLMHKSVLEENPALGVMYRKPLGKPDPDPHEKEANAFAAELLVPLRELKRYVGNGIKDVSLLSKIFGVSKDVISFRLKDVRRI